VSTCNSIYVVAYLLKARAVEPEKYLFLANGSETTFVSRQRLGKHVPAATDTHATTEILLETTFLLDPCKGVIRKTTGTTESALYGSL
jgi:hypothetical protein